MHSYEGQMISNMVGLAAGVEITRYPVLQVVLVWPIGQQRPIHSFLLL
jgi:hypothetical protein